jgi:hypothetical protein
LIRLADRVAQDPHDVVDAISHFLRADADDSNAVGSEEPDSPVVFLHLRRMVRAVDLHRQSQHRAIEVDDEADDDVLASKLEAIEPAVTQSSPQQRFGPRRVATHLSSLV